MYDIIIIGSGPAGLTAAIYASRARLQTLVLERDTMGAGQIAVTEQVDNYPGLPHIGGYELGEKFREHATELGTLFCENDVTHLEKKDGYFTATLEDHTELQARSVIYAAGTSYRRLEIAGGRLAGVSYCATCDGAFYQGKVVAVIGGGDTALEDALYLSRMAKTVYLVHRRDTFRANAALQEAVQKTENIVLVTNAVPTEITGEKRVETLKLRQSGRTFAGRCVCGDRQRAEYQPAGGRCRTGQQRLCAGRRGRQDLCRGTVCRRGRADKGIAAGNHSGGGRCKLCGFCGKIPVGKQRIKMVMK